VTRLVLLATSPRVAAGLLSSPAWLALHAGPVFVAADDSLHLEALTAAAVDVSAIDAAQPLDVIARELLAAARDAGTATLLVGRAEVDEVAAAVADAIAIAPGAAEGVDVEVLYGSWDTPGAHLLDVVATVDRLRSPGGCPWDAQQDHASLAPYLLEEAYEAFAAIEDAEPAAICDELGDVLFQVVFHARVAMEQGEGARWSIDDVADGLVDKLVRRHPHVFGGQVVAGAEEVNTNWESIKAAERGDASVVASVPLAAPALTLAATLQRKAARVGITPTGVAGETSLTAVAQHFEHAPSAESAAELLWIAVAAMCALDIDAEAALRARARRFRDEVETATSAGRPLGGLPSENRSKR
jgi:XTP/dITP diphosphohydrolase